MYKQPQLSVNCGYLRLIATNFGFVLGYSHPIYNFCLRASHARGLLPAALDYASFRFVLQFRFEFDL